MLLLRFNPGRWALVLVIAVWMSLGGAHPAWAAANANASSPQLAASLTLLEQAQSAAAQGHSAQARAALQTFLQSWPAVGRLVEARSEEAAQAVEDQAPQILALLKQTPPQTERAARLIARLRALLAPMAGQVRYSAWDAAFILLRMGMEMLLVLAALFTYVNRSGHTSERVWVWGGIASGLVASVAVAWIFTAILTSALVGVGQALIQGLSGLVSVFLLLLIGASMHRKSHPQLWQTYMERKIGRRLTQQSAVYSLGLMAFLAVFREGVEGTILYAALASALSLSQLLLGVGGAVVVLVAFGYVVISLGARLPIRPFFLTLSVVIYYLALKFAGQSIRALQAAGKLPLHAAADVPAVGWLGLYPTWETISAQLAVLGVVVIAAIYAERRVRRARPPRGGFAA